MPWFSSNDTDDDDDDEDDDDDDDDDEADTDDDDDDNDADEDVEDVSLGVSVDVVRSAGAGRTGAVESSTALRFWPRRRACLASIDCRSVISHSENRVICLS